MSSLRLSEADLRLLHEATPRGVALARTLRAAMDLAGGPQAVRAALEEAGRDQMAAARVGRLRQRSHRSVVLSTDEQVTLAEAAADWTRLLARAGLRAFEPTGRALHLRAPPPSLRRRARLHRPEGRA